MQLILEKNESIMGQCNMHLQPSRQPMIQLRVELLHSIMETRAHHCQISDVDHYVGIRKLLQSIFNIHTPVGNSNIFIQEFLFVRLHTQGMTCPGP
jgi:hypothetical protein